MRSVVLSSRTRHLLKMSSLGVLSVLIAGCSSGFQRFDRSVYEDVIPQQTTYSQNAQNPYPGDVDPTTTASANRRLEPSSVVAPQSVPQGVYHKPEPTFAQARQPVYSPPVSQPSRQPLASYTPSQPSYQSARSQASTWKKPSAISSSSLPKPKAAHVSVDAEPVRYAPPQPEDDAVYIPPAKPNALTTASVKETSVREAGWTSTGGTTINIREGETLYNLSKRYGVPVEAIRKANGMTATESLQTGQSVVIPNYIFSREAAISAPDNNPQTRAASAGTGYIGEARSNNISVPTKRPSYQYAAVSPDGSAPDTKSRRGAPKNHVITPGKTDKTPDYGIVTGSVDGAYKVKPGDSLSKIASASGTTVAELQKLNGITGNNIRVGQSLFLPKAIDRTTTASLQNVPADVDPIVTGAIKKSDSASEPAAPARTGISEFRWPVKGRVVSEFGASASNGANEGIDISVPEGTAVRSTENGVVIYAGNGITAYGNLILVRHDDNWVSAYAHNRDFEVKKGDSVRRGQIIARSGKTGNADRPKLHFELRKDSKPVNPKKYLAGA